MINNIIMGIFSSLSECVKRWRKTHTMQGYRQNCQIMKFLGLYMVTTFVVLPIVCYNLPFSWWFDLYHSQDDMKNLALTLNEQRLKKAREYFKYIDLRKSIEFYKKSKEVNIAIAVAIVTVKRNFLKGNDMGYLSQAVASMDYLIKRDRKFGSIYMFVCNVNQDPEAHVEVASIEGYVPVIQRFGANITHARTVRNLLYNKMNHVNSFEKETIDYMFCLEHAKELNPRYVLLLEDDVMPCSLLFDILWDKITNQMMSNKNFSHIKLYYPEKWQGYAFELKRILELISFAAVGAGMALLVHSIARLFSSSSRESYHTRLLYFVFGAIFLATIVHAIGRQTILELRRMTSFLYYVKDSDGCCTPAMLYPNYVIHPLLDFIGQEGIRTKYHLDLAIKEFVTEKQYAAYQIEPNLFRHTGMYTSLEHHSVKQPREFLFTSCWVNNGP